MSYRRAGVCQIPKNQCFCRTSFHACRQVSHGKPLITEVALLDNAVGAGGVGRVDFRDMGPGVFKVKAACAIRTSGHTESTADAAVIVHHYDTVRPLKSSLCRAYTHAGRVFTVVA